MALHRLIDAEFGVPEPAVLDDFYQEIGLTGGPGNWGGSEQPDQIRIVEAPYRQLRSMRIGCESEEDLTIAANNLDGLGISYTLGGGLLKVVDPLNFWEVTVEPAPVFDICEQPLREVNRPGNRPREGVRAEVIVEEKLRAPRRLGHIVVGTPEPQKTPELYKALGFRVTDIVGGAATFLRCSHDHHSFLITPGLVPYMNHYALEHDDFDAVGAAATTYLRSHEDDRHIAGMGRHMIGGNVFWYMKDPAGNFFEFFADMDRIVDDEAWEIRTDWSMDDIWSVWGDKDVPEIFFKPHDMKEVIAGWNKAHG